MNILYELTSKIVSIKHNENKLTLSSLNRQIQSMFAIFETYLKSRKTVERCVELHRGWKEFNDNSTGVWDYCHLKFEFKLLKRFRRWLINVKEPFSNRCVNPVAARKLFDSYLISVNKDLIRLSKDLAKY